MSAKRMKVGEAVGEVRGGGGSEGEGGRLAAARTVHVYATLSCTACRARVGGAPRPGARARGRVEGDGRRKEKRGADRDKVPFVAVVLGWGSHLPEAVP
jgi:hypothetical protein